MKKIIEGFIEKQKKGKKLLKPKIEQTKLKNPILY